MKTRRDILLVIVLCGMLGAYAAITRPPAPITAPDTLVYVAGSPLVPIGYPFLIDTFGIEGVAILQPLVFAVALAGLGVELIAISGSAVVAITALAAIVLIPELMTYHASILTESLFISGLIGFVATAVRFARAPSWRVVLVAAIVAGTTASIRRTAYAFAPVVFLMALLLWRTRRARAAVAIAAGILPLMLLYAADHIAARMQHGDDLTSLAGPHLFAKAALIDAPPHALHPAGQLHMRVARELQDRFAPVRALLDAAPPATRASLLLYYETCLQNPCVAALRDSIGLPDARTNDILAAVARERILAAPGRFAALTATHYRSLWTAYKLRHPDTGAQLAQFLAAHRPLPFEREAFKLAPGAPIAFTPSASTLWIQPLVVALGIFTAAIAIGGVVWAVVVGDVPAPLIAASLASLTAHGSLIFTSVGAAGISRFMIAVFPAVVIASGLGGWWLIQKALGRPSRPRYD